MKLLFLFSLLCLPVYAQTVAHRPPLVVTTGECAQAQDEFLCRALRRGAELIEQQINCEVTQSYTQKDWDGRLLTKQPDDYYVRVSNGKEVFQRINTNGELSRPASRPRYQAIKIYATASWYETQAAIFQKGKFFGKRAVGDGFAYSFFVLGAFTLTSNDRRTLSDVSGQVEFDKAGLLRRIYLRHTITPEQTKRHRFLFLEEETILANPPGFEEVSPVPVRFWSKSMTTWGTQVVIEATYRDYKRFESEIVFR